MIDLRIEGGSLVAYCGKCGFKMIGTTARLEQVRKSGQLEAVEAFCTGCGSKSKVKLQLTPSK